MVGKPGDGDIGARIAVTGRSGVGSDKTLQGPTLFSSAQLGARADTRTSAGGLRPIILDPRHMPDPRARCGARSFSVCSAIEDQDLCHFASLAVVTEIDAGRCASRQASRRNVFFNVTAGAAKLYKLLAEGRRQLTGFAGRGAFLASRCRPPMRSAPRRSSRCGSAGSRCRCCAVCWWTFRIRNDVYRRSRRRSWWRRRSRAVAGRNTAKERLAGILLMQIAPGAEPMTQITPPMPHGDITNYLGLTIETVSRSLSRLRADRLIDIPTTNNVAIRSRAALDQRTGGLN